ncbi:MAG: DUF4404 family protein [Chlorobium sp.]|nr:DUF4404 family protein [Chlorobium phaeovibrioides]NQU45573.1 DUF4404 family protein [Chlorobium sp.]
MEQEKLREQLEALHHELEKVDCIDDTTARILSTLRDDIRNIGDKQAENCPTAEDEPLMERMSDAVGHFEADHPKLSMTIKHLLDSLANMGL